MLRSLMTAVTGVRAHQTMLDVVGNNIANVNTTGFKKDFTVFQDILYQTSKSASGPGDNLGGVNASQVGLGVSMAAIETIQTQGSAQYTGNKSDMMIEGEGYFIFGNGGSYLYSRAGNFVLDANSTLVHSGTGYQVQGYAMERDPLNPMEYITGSSLTDIKIPIGAKMEARATTTVGYKCNLDSTSDAYLPIGYTDIPTTDASKEAKVRINGENYTMHITTNGATTAADGTNYMTIEVSYAGASPTTITLDMVGIYTDGTTSYPDLNVNNGSQITLPDGKTVVNVLYDDATGVLQFREDGTGATLWKTNLQESMNYNSFSVSVMDASSTQYDYDFIAEFDENKLSSSPVQMTLWWEDPNTSGKMQQATYDVYLDQEGNFESVVPQAASGPLPNPLAWGINFQIVPSSSGSGLEFQAAPAADASLETVGTINQGGYHSTKITVYDCQGKPYTMELVFKKLTENRWRWEVSFPGEEKLFISPSSGEILFDDSCKIVEPSDSVPITVDFGMNGTSFQTIALDFSGKTFGLDTLEGVTQYASETTTRGYYQDGYAMGVMEDYSVSQDGTITGIYTNGQNQPIYRLALAQFTNPQGLEKVGGTMFRESVNSGSARIGAASTDGSGVINSGSLEMSNVDLTEEFTRLIIAQRGFQANTRIVTVSDQILEEVVNLKR